MQSSSKMLNRYELLHLLGEGAHGKVFLCRKARKNGPSADPKKQKIYAIKILDKKHILDRNELEHTRAEKMVMKDLNHPFMVSLKYSFVTETSICFVMEFMRGGELFQHLKREHRFSEEQTQFVAACIILALGNFSFLIFFYFDLD